MIVFKSKQKVAKNRKWTYKTYESGSTVSVKIGCCKSSVFFFWNIFCKKIKEGRYRKKEKSHLFHFASGRNPFKHEEDDEELYYYFFTLYFHYFVFSLIFCDEHFILSFFHYSLAINADQTSRYVFTVICYILQAK